MADEATTAPIQDRYAQQFAADLEHNRAQQQNLTRQVEEVQARLAQLQAEERWLIGIRASLPSGQPNQDTEAPTDAEQAASAGDQLPAPGAPAVEETAVPQLRAAARNDTPEPVKGENTKKKTTKTDAAPPTLGELLAGILSGHQGEPRTAGEVCDELEQQHPKRARNTPVVRSTLERLVAVGMVERTRQGRTVLYTLAHNTRPTNPASTVDDTPADQESDKAQA
ncbi:BlaI/MecI/CopY family transcriptional regulator [Streptomyces sp. NPDC005706]|uniref:BlaI/MecI/CopY family transcriptional regulator n=1 Tax=Streptomyces sp. NPDC005706 TaxID=3157169 RepID=UPI0033E8309B